MTRPSEMYFVEEFRIYLDGRILDQINKDEKMRIVVMIDGVPLDRIRDDWNFQSDEPFRELGMDSQEGSIVPLGELFLGQVDMELQAHRAIPVLTTSLPRITKIFDQ